MIKALGQKSKKMVKAGGEALDAQLSDDYSGLQQKEHDLADAASQRMQENVEKTTGNMGQIVQYMDAGVATNGRFRDQVKAKNNAHFQRMLKSLGELEMDL